MANGIFMFVGAAVFGKTGCGLLKRTARRLAARWLRDPAIWLLHGGMRGAADHQFFLIVVSMNSPIRGKPVRTTISALPGRPRQPPLPCVGAEQALGVGLHLRRDMGWLRLRRLRHRHLRQAHCRLARQLNGTCQLRLGCARTGTSRSAAIGESPLQLF